MEPLAQPANNSQGAKLYLLTVVAIALVAPRHFSLQIIMLHLSSAKAKLPDIIATGCICASATQRGRVGVYHSML